MDVQSLKIDRGARKVGAGGAGARRRRSPWIGRIAALAILAGLGFALRGPLQRGLDWLNLPRVELYRVVESRPAEAGAVTGTAANGYVVAARRAALSADTPGRIVELSVTEGSVVKRGDVVAKLYQDEYRASLQRATAALATAKVSVTRAEAALANAEVQVEQVKRTLEALRLDVGDAAAQRALADARFQREQELLESGISSQDALDAARAAIDSATARQRAADARQRAAEAGVAEAEASVLTARADVEVAKARVAEAEADRELAAATLDKTEIRAPFDGVVVLKDAEVGEVVSPNSQGGSNARGSICTMVDFASLEVQAEVPESSLDAVHLDGPTQIFLDAYPDQAYGGHVDRIWPTANRQKATVEVRIRFDTRDDKLRPEMGVRLVFLPPDAAPGVATGPGGPPVILVPQDAVVRDSARGEGVFVYARGAVTFRTVRVGARDGRRATVEQGLDAGERIVLDPPADLRDGDRVKVPPES
ncbi:MAG: efflux RND transporter periplasmic adaptor subunit [Planctomycetes bacterium]|nr:efflux RND transporter periplasmic adaptor subunit [Planctomycetota bacterium]